MALWDLAVSSRSTAIPEAISLVSHQQYRQMPCPLNRHNQLEAVPDYYLPSRSEITRNVLEKATVKKPLKMTEDTPKITIKFPPAEALKPFQN